MRRVISVCRSFSSRAFLSYSSPVIHLIENRGFWHEELFFRIKLISNGTVPLDVERREASVAG